MGANIFNYKNVKKVEKECKNVSCFSLMILIPNKVYSVF